MWASEFNKLIRPGEYVGCICNKEVWYGIVEEYCEEFNDFIVNFLHPSGTSGATAYHYPSTKDSCAVPGHHILTVMSCPSLRGGSRIQYIFPKKKKLKKALQMQKLCWIAIESIPGKKYSLL